MKQELKRKFEDFIPKVCLKFAFLFVLGLTSTFIFGPDPKIDEKDLF